MKCFTTILKISMILMILMMLSIVNFAQACPTCGNAAHVVYLQPQQEVMTALIYMPVTTALCVPCVTQLQPQLQPQPVPPPQERQAPMPSDMREEVPAPQERQAPVGVPTPAYYQAPAYYYQAPAYQMPIANTYMMTTSYAMGTATFQNVGLGCGRSGIFNRRGCAQRVPVAGVPIIGGAPVIAAPATSAILAPPQHGKIIQRRRVDRF